MEMVCLFGFLLPLHELHFGGARGRAERESGALGKNESDRGRGEGKGREGRNVKGGGDASVAICLCANSWLLWQPVKSHYL